MSDVTDEIISKLSPEVLIEIEKYEPRDASPKDYNHKLDNTLKEFENIRVNRQIRDVQNSTKYLESKTKENKLKLLRYQKELKGLKELMQTPENVQKNDKYDQMIHNMQVCCELYLPILLFDRIIFFRNNFLASKQMQVIQIH